MGWIRGNVFHKSAESEFTNFYLYFTLLLFSNCWSRNLFWIKLNSICYRFLIGNSSICISRRNCIWFCTSLRICCWILIRTSVLWWNISVIVRNCWWYNILRFDIIGVSCLIINRIQCACILLRSFGDSCLLWWLSFYFNLFACLNWLFVWIVLRRVLLIILFNFCHILCLLLRNRLLLLYIFCFWRLFNLLIFNWNRWYIRLWIFCLNNSVCVSLVILRNNCIIRLLNIITIIAKIVWNIFLFSYNDSRSHCIIIFP